MPPPPPVRLPDPPAPTGTLSVRCDPAECDIKINGQPAARTDHGKLIKPGLTPGEITVDFEKEGYLPQQKTVNITVEAGPEVAVVLEPTEAAKAANGKRLFVAMLHALQIEDSVDKLRDFSGEGNIKCYGAAQRDWDFSVMANAPAQVEMQVKNSAGGMVYQCIGLKCDEKKQAFRIPFTGKKLRGPILDDLEVNLRAFAEHSLGPLLQTLREPSVQFSSANFAESGERRLRAETSDGIYDIVLGADLLPSAASYENKAGLGSGLKMLFADYTDLSGGHYPRRTTIRLPDPAQHGVEVNLDKIGLPPPPPKK
jgi:hypothetical protein